MLDGSTFRRLATRWCVGTMTAWRRVQRTQKQKHEPGTVVTLFLPTTLPLLMLDGKRFRFRCKPWTLYVALDPKTKLPVALVLLPRWELRLGYDLILSALKAKKYCIHGVTSDNYGGIVAAVKDAYPKAVHQKCAAHVLQDCRRKLGGKHFTLLPMNRDIWQLFREIAIGCDTYLEAEDLLNRAELVLPEYQKAWKALRRQLPGIYEFTKYKPLKGYRTSNIMENFMGILEQRLKTMRGVKTPETLLKITTSIVQLHYKRPTKK